MAEGLRSAGHEVHTPTLTGLGDRSHLLTAEVGVATHARDIVEVLEYERLDEVTLVAHSYGGMPATVAAVEASGRVAQLVCVDGFLPERGESALDLLPEHVAVHYRDGAIEQDGVQVIPPRPLERLGVTDEVATAWLTARLVPQPLLTYTETVNAGASDLEVPGLYLQCRGWASPFDHLVERAADLGWPTDRLQADHEVMATAPDLLVEALLDAREG